MTAKLGRTPRRRSFAERAVLHFLPADEGPEIVGDLEEARRARFPSGGLRSSVWYWTHGALLAMGFVDLVMEAGLAHWDIAPLIPIVEGAGGVLTDWQGGPWRAGGNVLAAGDARTHAQALKLIAS